MAKTRSLGGCSTCRTSHTKCDEGRPRCAVCDRLGIRCGGYDIRITFSFEHCGALNGSQRQQKNGDGDDSPGSFRRPLFTEAYRRRMSQDVLSAVPPKTTDDVLLLVDSTGARFDAGAPTGKAQELMRGPFGVFRPERGVGGNHQQQRRQSTAKSPSSLSILDILLPDEPGARREFTSTFRDAHLDINGGVEPSHRHHDLPGFLGDLPSPQCSRHSSHSGLGPRDRVEDVTSSSSVCITSPLLGQRLFPSAGHAPADAPSLLHHYQTSVISLFSPLKNQKTPWNILFLPSAMNTLASLTVGMIPNYASLCIFQALLSISAFHKGTLSAEPHARYWKDRANGYLDLAQQTLKTALYEQGLLPKRAKYKETLMALLSMATATVFSGQWKHTRCCLHDAGALIRQRGLAKPQKSRRVRMLHHCYAYLKIMHESTFLEAKGLPEPEQRSQSGTGQEQSPLRARPWDGRLDYRLLMDKPMPLGENDLLLEVPGRWHLTLYPSIFGVPESFLVLLSEALRLGNERHVLLQRPAEANLTWQQYQQRTKVLEKCICHWEATCNPGNSIEGWTLTQSNQALLNNMLLALKHALMIYYYRKVLDVDSTILQAQVEETIDVLLQCEQLDGYMSVDYCSAAFAWAGFVAACEALDAAVQEKFASWLRGCFRRSGIRTFEAALQLAEEIWARRKLDDAGVSWLDIAREKGIYMFFA
ncbi:Pfam:DUF3468 [Geosmithia morbida]|uniref:Pfam:DUF3468 n=1 Tax=Geosmithia morbida TaxID=1094350 RepID=A0A9P4Z0H2_9HYPO|nr:Pfam:DUF3468 [Geosmithia morbida]KAF4126441.1 Pfam:DUF3468 [Geosmithia morbida]